MIRKIYQSILLILLLMAGLSACTDTQLVQDSEGTTVLPNGDILLKSEVSVLGTPQVVTRDIDPDGLVITNIWMLCFDEKNCYIGRRQATFTTVTNESGTSYKLSVGVPQSTKIVHIIGNMSLDDFTAPVGISENTLVPSLLSASGRMTYWARYKFTDTPENFKGVKLLCNQAKVSYEVSAVGVTVEGFALCYRRAWGTVAPFNPSAEDDKFGFPLGEFGKLYITSPDGEHLGLSPDPEDVSTAEEQYLFEDPNTLEEPVYAIMKIRTPLEGQEGTESKYYKIMFVDGESNQLPLYRNYEYKIKIEGMPTSFGYDSFDGAKNGTAANNVWVSVAPEVPSLSDGTHTLDVIGGTTYIYTARGSQSIPFTYNGDGTVNVSWLQNDGSVSIDKPTCKKDGNGNNYTIQINLAEPTDQPAVGVILLRAGNFTRQIKVYLMKEMEFTPVLVSSAIPQIKDQEVRLTFNIPDTYPEELFPIACKIATNKMNPVDTEDDHFTTTVEDCVYQITHTNEETGEETTDEHSTDWGYKFVYMIKEPGLQEVTLKLNSSLGNDAEGTVKGCKEEEGLLHTHIFLEADYFKDVEKIIHFQKEGAENHIMLVDGNNGNKEQVELQVIPTVNQLINCSLSFKGENVPAGTYMRISTEALKDLELGSSASGVEIKDSLKSALKTDYWIYFNQEFPKDSRLNLRFRTKSANVNDYVRFFIDDNGKYPNKETRYKSATLVLKSKASYDFELYMDKTEIPYGIGQPVVLNFMIPSEAINQTELKLHLLTNNLRPDPRDPHASHLKQIEGGYELNVPKGTASVGNSGKLYFLTTRIASAENVTLRTADNSQAMFTPFVGEYTNTPAIGKISLPDNLEFPTDYDPFIALERKNGTRIGVFNIKNIDGGSADYELVLRPEYEFTMDETLTVHYHNLVSTRIFRTTTTFNDLLKDNCQIQLEEK